MVHLVDHSKKAININQLEKICKHNYFFNSSKTKVVEKIRQLKKTLEKDWETVRASTTNKRSKEKAAQLKNLENKTFRLVRATQQFRHQCWFGRTIADKVKNEVDRWAFNPLTQQALTFDQKKGEKDCNNNDSLKEQIASIFSDEQLENLSFPQLLEKQKKLNSFLDSISVNDHQLNDLWWKKNKKLLLTLQKKTVDCSRYETKCKTIDLTNRLTATSIFSFVNLTSFLPSIVVGNEHLPLQPTIAVSFIIKSMEQMLLKNEVPKKEKDKFTTFLDSYKSGYRIKCYQNLILPSDASHMTVADIKEKKKKLKKHFIRELKTNNQVTCCISYIDDIRLVSLIFFIRKDKNGERWVHCEVVDRYDTVNPIVIDAGIRRSLPFLRLAEVSLTTLKRSQFLNLLLDLNFTKIPNGSTILNLPNSTSYNRKDWLFLLYDFE